MIPKSQVTRQLLDWAQPGGVLLVHCAFSQGSRWRMGRKD